MLEQKTIGDDDMATQGITINERKQQIKEQIYNEQVNDFNKLSSKIGNFGFDSDKYASADELRKKAKANYEKQMALSNKIKYLETAYKNAGASDEQVKQLSGQLNERLKALSDATALYQKTVIPYYSQFKDENEFNSAQYYQKYKDMDLAARRTAYQNLPESPEKEWLKQFMDSENYSYYTDEQLQSRYNQLVKEIEAIKNKNTDSGIIEMGYNLLNFGNIYGAGGVYNEHGESVGGTVPELQAIADNLAKEIKLRKYNQVTKNADFEKQSKIEDEQMIADLLLLQGSNKMTREDEDVSIYKYIYQTEGKEAAQDFGEYIANKRSKENYQKFYEGLKSDIESSGPWGEIFGSIAAIPSAILSGVEFFDDAVGSVLGKPIDTSDNLFTNANTIILGTTAKEIEDSIGGTWGKIGSTGYQLGMSMLTTLASMLTGNALGGAGSTAAQAISLGIMSSSASANTLVSAKMQGKSDAEAFGLSILSGAAELITEKIGMDALFSNGLFKGMTKSTLAKYMLTNMGAEGLEEGASNIINYVADIMISKDESEWRKAIEKYTNGYVDENGIKHKPVSESEAVGLALGDFASELGTDVLGGMISGLFFAGGNVIVSNYSAGDNIIKLDNIQPLVTEALTFDKDTKTYKIASTIQSKLDSGKKISRDTIGNLYNTAYDQAKTDFETIKKSIDNGQIKGNDATLQLEAAFKHYVKLSDIGSVSVTTPTETAQSETIQVKQESALPNEENAPQGKIEQDLNGFEAIDSAMDDLWGVKSAKNMVDTEYGKKYNKIKATEGEINARKENTRDSGKWDGSVDSRESVRGVEKSTRQSTERQQAQRFRAKEIRNAVADLQSRGQDTGEISSKSLGLKSGTNEKSITIVPKTAYTDELNLIKAEAEISGYNVVFFVGEIKLKDGGTARGAISGNTIYVRADHNNLSAEQIYLHEKFHGMLAKDSGLIQSATEAISENYSASELDSLVQYYIEAYDGANLSYTEALEEILCDAFAGINIFEGTDIAAELGGYGAAKYSGEVRIAGFESNQSNEADLGEAKLSRNIYDEYASNAMQWANSAGTKQGDTKVLLTKKGWTLIIADANSDGGYNKLGYGSFKEMKELELAHKEANNEIYGNTQSFRADKGRDTWNLQFSENGRYGDGNDRQVGSKGFQTDPERNDEHLRSGDKRKSNVRTTKLSREIDQSYLEAVERGDIETAQRLVDEAAKKAGYDYHLYHGTNADFTKFDLRKHGGKNGKGEGYGIYLAANKEISAPYGKNVIDSYTKFNRLAEGREKTLSYAEVKNLVKKSCELEAKRTVDDGEYDSIAEALKDTWVSNYVYTYDYSSMAQVYTDVANILWKENDNDGDIINEIMTSSGAHYDYENALDFYDNVLTPVTNIDGFHYIWGDKNSGGAENDIYLAFKSEQIKSADPITYDDNGNVIPLSERFNTNEADIRYSRESATIEELRKENEKLQKRVEKWKRETRIKPQAEFDEISMNKFARGLLKSYDSTLKYTDINSDLLSLGKDILNKKSDFDEIKSKATEIAERIVNNSVNELQDDTFNQIKSYVKGTKFKLSEQDRADIADFEQFRRSNFGRFIISSKEGIPVDTAYMELQGMFGTVLFPEDITHPADQIQHIADLYNDFNNIQNQSSFDVESAVEYLSQNIIDSLTNDAVLQKPETIASRIKTTEKTKAQEKANAAIEKVRKQRDRKIAELKNYYQEKKRTDRENRIERADIQKYKNQIKRNTDELKNWVLKPDNKNLLKHIPDSLKNSIIPFIESIDFSSKSLLNKNRVTEADKKFFAGLRNLQNAMDDFVTESGGASTLYLPPQFQEELKLLVNAVQDLVTANQGDFVINRMSAEELKNLSNVVKMLKNFVVYYNKVYQQGLNKTLSDLGDNSIEFMSELGYKETNKAFKGTVEDFLMWTTERPAFLFERFGEGGIAIYKGFRKGQDKLAFSSDAIVKFAHETYTRAEVLEWSENKITVEFDGKDVEMTSAQLMALYELCKRPQALNHILNNGIRLSTDNKAIKPTYEELIKAFETKLTDRQIKVADALQHYMATESAKLGNEVTQIRFGENMFGEKTYFPIEADGKVLPATAGNKESKAADLYALLNMSFTKQLNPKASNRIVVSNIFDIFANHTSEMAQYNAFALPVLDALKWINYKQTYVNDDGKLIQKNSVRDEMARAYGIKTDKEGNELKSYAESFVINLLKAYNGTEAMSQLGEGKALKALGYYNRAAVTFNTRVILQQPSAIARAALLLDGKTILKGLKQTPNEIKSNIEEMQKYSGVALWKALGFYDVNVSTGLKEQIKQNQSNIDKISEVGMKGAELADKVTWSAIWNACKVKIEKNGAKSTDVDYFEKVNDLFSDVIYKTQVVDSILAKAEILRGSGITSKTFTSFMNEPLTTVGLITNAYDRYRLDVHRGMSKVEALKRNGKIIAKATRIYIASTILQSALAALADAWRDDDEYQTFIEKYLEAFIENFFDEINPLTKYPFLSSLVDMAKGLAGAFGADTHGYPVNTIIGDLSNGLIKFAEKVYEISQGETNYTVYSAVYDMLKLFNVSGLPLASATREVISVWNNTVGAVYPDLIVKTYNPSDENKIKYAYVDGFLTEEEAIQELLDKGIYDNEDDAYFALVNADKDSQYNQIKKSFYEGYLARLSENDIYNGLSEKQKENINEDIKDFSNQAAKVELREDAEIDSTKKKVMMYEDNGLDPIYIYLADALANEYSEKHTAEDGVTKSDYKKAVRQSDFEKDIQDLLIALNDASGKKNEEKLVDAAFNRFN